MGKFLGPGGGGFLLLFAERDKREQLKKTLGLREVEFSFEPQGSKIIYVG